LRSDPLSAFRNAAVLPSGDPKKITKLSARTAHAYYPGDAANGLPTLMATTVGT
jgi:hypothetical protein